MVGIQSNIGSGPGINAEIASEEKEVLFGDVVWAYNDPMPAIVSSAQDDANTPVTTLRAGLIMGKITASGLWTDYDPAATDGSEVAQGVLRQEISTLNNLNVAEQKQGVILIIGLLKATQLVGLDSAARVQMSKNFVFDDDIPGAGWGGPFLKEVEKAANYTVLPADNMTEFVATAAAVFTLPAILPGYRFKFRNQADTAMGVASAAGNDMIAIDDLAASSVTFATASELIGGAFIIYTNQAGTKWIIEDVSPDDYTITVV